MNPVILYGAFDRHNLGDMLFPHVVAALMPGREVYFAGLVAADLRPWGGHLVRSLPEVLAAMGNRPVDLIHVGGEVLTCTVVQAAVMTLPQDDARALLSRRDSGDLDAWARKRLGGHAAPYVVALDRLPSGSRTLFLGVGGESLEKATPALRREVFHALHQAAFLGARDGGTLEHLFAAFLPATLMPDPGVLAAEMLAAAIAEHSGRGEPADVAAAFPGGYLILQFGGDFGDDATLAVLARQAEEFAQVHDLGVVLLRAGGAPWHDDLASLGRAAALMAPGRCRVAESLHILDLCALIQGCRLWCGSSLHGWILAASWGRPRAGLALAHGGVGAKLRSYLRTWEKGSQRRVVEPGELSIALAQAWDAAPAATPAALCREILERALA